MATSATVATSATTTPSTEMASKRLPTTAKVAKSIAKRPEVVEPLFTHTVAEGVLFHTGTRGFRSGLPSRAGVSFPSARGVMAVNIPVPVTIDIVLVETMRSRGRPGNVCVEVAVVSADSCAAIVI